MKRNLLKCILWVLLLAGCFPLLAVAGAQQKEQRYKIAVCDWMILKRQKIGSFQLVHELKGDGVELDMGGLGKRERTSFPATVSGNCTEIPSRSFIYCHVRILRAVFFRTD